MLGLWETVQVHRCTCYSVTGKKPSRPSPCRTAIPRLPLFEAPLWGFMSQRIEGDQGGLGYPSSWTKNLPSLPPGLCFPRPRTLTNPFILLVLSGVMGINSIPYQKLGSRAKILDPEPKTLN